VRWLVSQRERAPGAGGRRESVAGGARRGVWHSRTRTTQPCLRCDPRAPDRVGAPA